MWDDFVQRLADMGIGPHRRVGALMDVPRNAGR
jgi:hypothetical protein